MKTAILGLGIIGQTWADNLRADGVPLRLWNRTPKQVPDFYLTAREAVEGAEMIILVVADIPAVKSVLEEISTALRPGQILLQCSTITPEAVKQACEQVTQTGADFLDAPFTGSKPAAKARQTVFFIGGKESVLARARPVLERISKAILPMGEVGAASAIKLAMNLNIAQVSQALCESLAVARQAGITDEAYFAALELNVSKSGVADLKSPALRKRDYAPAFALKHMLKDLRQARSMAEGLNLPALDRTIEIYEAGMKAGWAEEDFIGLYRLLDSQCEAVR